MKHIIRVFPRRTKATPVDDMVRIGEQPGMFDEADEVHISVAFTWDLKDAEILERQWRHVAPTRIGGPATGERGEGFTPGMYLRPGYTITSRGCPNHCWFCSVWKREGRAVRELPIMDGWNVLDDNLLACSEEHIRSVFAMLASQKHKPEFTGGLEAKRLKPWIAVALKALHPKQLFFAYDTPDDLEPLRRAGEMMLAAEFTEASHALRCYVLCGWPKKNGRKADTMDAAQVRIQQALDCGFTPMAMLYRDGKGLRDETWMRWARKRIRPAIIHSKKSSTPSPA